MKAKFKRWAKEFTFWNELPLKSMEPASNTLLATFESIIGCDWHLFWCPSTHNEWTTTMLPTRVLETSVVGLEQVEHMRKSLSRFSSKTKKFLLFNSTFHWVIVTFVIWFSLTFCRDRHVHVIIHIIISRVYICTGTCQFWTYTFLRGYNFRGYGHANISSSGLSVDTFQCRLILNISLSSNSNKCWPRWNFSVNGNTFYHW